MKLSVKIKTRNSNNPMASSTPIITRSVALNIISMADFCYRRGVNDAYLLSDEGLARDYLEQIKDAGKYGFLNEECVTMDWREWALRLMAQARLTAWNGVMTRYFERIITFGRNYLSAFIPVSKLFYIRGVKDYLNAPDMADLTMFNSRTRQYWTEKGLKRMSIPKYVDDITLACYDLRRRDEELYAGADNPYAAKKAGVLNPKQYELFIRAMSLAVMKRCRQDQNY